MQSVEDKGQKLTPLAVQGTGTACSLTLRSWLGPLHTPADVMHVRSLASCEHLLHRVWHRHNHPSMAVSLGGWRVSDVNEQHSPPLLAGLGSECPQQVLRHADRSRRASKGFLCILPRVTPSTNEQRALSSTR